MGWEAWLTLAVVAAVVALLASERLAPPLVVLGGVTVLLVTGVVDASAAFGGFSNPAPITIAALYVLAGAVGVTGLLDPLVGRTLGTGEGPERVRLARLLFPAAISSAFLNNTTIVAMGAPRIAGWARRVGSSPSRYLMPLSFAAILGGLGTLMGTSTTIIVSGLLLESGREPLAFFEITRVGVPVALAGCVIIIATAPRILPRRRAPGEDLGSDAREFTVEMIVEPASPLLRKSVAEAGLRNLQGVYLVEIERDGRLIAPVSPEEVLEGGDRLTFAGNAERVLDLQQMPGLRSAEERHFGLTTREAPRFYEVVVAPGSDLAGTTLKNVGFRGRYGAAVVAVHRAGARVPGKLGQVSIHPGDVLLVLGDADFRRRWHGHPDFLVVAPVGDRTPVRRERAFLVPAVTAGLITSVVTGLFGILEAALLAAVVLIAGRVLTVAEARRSIDLNVIILIAASFGLGAAVLESGLAERTAGLLTDGLGAYGGIGLLAGVMIATVILTELVTNNAAAILMFPIAVATAAGAGLEPRAFAIGVAVAASASFLTPIGYQTNTMIYGLGGYRYGDFARLGAPLTLTVLAVSLLVIPRVWGIDAAG